MVGCFVLRRCANQLGDCFGSNGRSSPDAVQQFALWAAPRFPGPVFLQVREGDECPGCGTKNQMRPTRATEVGRPRTMFNCPSHSLNPFSDAFNEIMSTLGALKASHGPFGVSYSADSKCRLGSWTCEPYFN